MKNVGILVAMVAVVLILVTAYTVLAIFHVDTLQFENFVQLLFGAITSSIGVFLIKRTGEAVNTASQAQEQVTRVSEQVAEVSGQVGHVEHLVNGNTAELIARVGPVNPANDVVFPIPTGENEG